MIVKIIQSLDLKIRKNLGEGNMGVITWVIIIEGLVAFTRS